MITQCLVLGCQSPPDLAYAMEYATSICGRAGVNVQLELPEEYLDTMDGAYFRYAFLYTVSRLSLDDAAQMSVPDETGRISTSARTTHRARAFRPARLAQHSPLAWSALRSFRLSTFIPCARFSRSLLGLHGMH